MATYKGIGFDNTNGKTRTGTSNDAVEFDTALETTETLKVGKDASIGGDLTVTGDIVSRGSVNLVVQDPVIDLGIGNTSTTAQAGGFTFSLNRNSGFTAETITASTNSGSSTSGAPELTASGATSFASGDLLVLTGSDNNNGIFVVNSVSGSTIVLKGTGGSSISGNLPFAQNQVETETGQTATAYKVDIKVLIVADGINFNDAGGSPYAVGTVIETYQTNAVESDFTSNGDYKELGAATSLQGAYDTAPQGTITTAGSNDIAFTLASGNFTVQNGSVDFGSSTALSTFNLDTSGAITVDSSGAGISIGVAGASDFTTSAGAITVSGVGLNLAGGNAEIDVTTTGALDLNSSAFTLDATTISIDGTDAGNLTITGADLLIGTVTSGELDLTSAGLMDVNAGANLDIDVTGTYDMLSSGTFTIAGTGNSSVTATSGDLTLQTATSGGIIVNSVSVLDVFSDDDTTIQMDATSGAKVLAINANNAGVAGGDTAKIELDAKTNVEIQINNASKVNVQNAQTIFNNTIQADGTAGLKFGAGGNLVDTILDEDTMASDDVNALATQQSIKAYVDSNGIANFSKIATMVADETIAVGKVVCVKITGGNEGRAQLAQATAGSSRGNVIGISITSGNAGDTIQVAQAGVIGGLSGLTAGGKIYLSDAGATGATQNTAPSDAGDIVFQVGFGKSSTELIIAPSFIMELG